MRKVNPIDIALMHTDMGTGHIEAAFAIQDAINKIDDSLRTDVLNSLDYANITIGGIVKFSYFYTIKKHPWLWELLYRGFKPTDAFSLTLARNIARYYLVKRLSRYCLSHRPRAFINTHFFPPPALVRVREKLNMDFKIYVAITDFDAHPLWQVEGIDGYFVGNEMARDKLLDLGVSKENIKITGVPIKPCFARKHTTEEARRLLKLPMDKKIIIISGGGEGMGPIPGILREIDSRLKDAVIVIICGRNTELREVLSYHRSRNNDIRVLGFIDYIHILYDAGDLYIGKTGGLTSAEILSKGLPTIALETIRGQERRNLEYLSETGGVLLANDPQEVGELVLKLLNNPPDLYKMADSMREYSKPNSSLDIVKTVLSDLN